MYLQLWFLREELYWYWYIKPLHLPHAHIFFLLLSLQRQHKTAASTWWVSLHSHLGALLLSASVERDRLVYYVLLLQRRKPYKASFVAVVCVCACVFFFSIVFVCFLFHLPLLYITTPSSLIVIPSWGLNDPADTSSSTCEVSASTFILLIQCIGFYFFMYFPYFNLTIIPE